MIEQLYRPVTPTPLVSVIIATRSRRDDLRLTLAQLRRQDYVPIELIIVDDASDLPVGPTVREYYPEAVILRHEGKNTGQCQARNEGAAIANGKYLLSLDDDCCFTAPGDLATAVRFIESKPAVGAVTFFVFNGKALPDHLDAASLRSGYVAGFAACAVLFRANVWHLTGGYRAFFENEWEEEELSLQMLNAASGIYFFPPVIAHHRLSAANRDNERTWMRGLRNRLWGAVIHIPFPRLVIELAWKLAVGCLDAVRMCRFRSFLQAIREFLLGLPGVWRLRSPLNAAALRRYDSLRLRPVLTETEFDNPPVVSLADLRDWWSRWRNRARDTSVWETRASGKGSSNTVRYAHELPPRGKRK